MSGEALNIQAHLEAIAAGQASALAAAFSQMIINASNDILELKKKMETLTNTIAGLQSTDEDILKTLAIQYGEIRDCNGRINSLEDTIAELNASYNSIHTEYTTISQANADLLVEADNHEERLVRLESMVFPLE